MNITEWGLSDTGFARPTFNDILDAKIARAKELLGEDIDTSDLSVFGKFIRIEAFDLAKAYEDLELTYYARFPNTASGTSLDRLCPFAGIKRNPDTAATHKVIISGTAGVTVGSGFVVSTEDDVTFTSTSDTAISATYKRTEDIAVDSEKTYYTLSNGNYTEVVTPTNDSLSTYYELEGSFGEMTVMCDTYGTDGNVGENAITVIVNPNADVDGIVSSEIIAYGNYAESDFDLRKRFAEAIKGIGSSTIAAITAEILRVPTVISVGIIENDTNETDSSGRAAHSFECYVYGGENYEQEIAEAIFSKKPVGIKSVSTSDTPISKTVLDAGGHSHTVVFSHTENVNIRFKIAIKKDSRFESDGMEQIKNNITDYISKLGVGADVVVSSLYGQIHAVTGVVEVTELKVSTDGINYTSESVAIQDWQVAKTMADSVIVEVVQ